MKKILLTLAFLPLAASAQECDSVCQIFREAYGLPETNQPQAPSYGLPVQPVLPVPQDKGPWGTGYSIVTTTKPKRNIFDSDLTGEETVQRVVPNDALGQPLKGFDFGY
jgi:hypothetical protein